MEASKDKIGGVLHYYLIAYDITDSKMVKKAHKVCKNFGHAVQYSVFICHLSDDNLAILKSRLAPLVDPKKDQVMYVKLREGKEGGLQKNSISIMGRPISPESPDYWFFA